MYSSTVTLSGYLSISILFHFILYILRPNILKKILCRTGITSYQVNTCVISIHLDLHPFKLLLSLSSLVAFYFIHRVEFPPLLHFPPCYLRIITGEKNASLINVNNDVAPYLKVMLTENQDKHRCCEFCLATTLCNIYKLLYYYYC